MRRLATVLLLLAGGASRAQPMDVFGFNPRSLSMGGVQAAAARDFSAVYYNPALMKEGSFGLGVAYSNPSFKVYATAEPTEGQALSAQLPPDYFGITLGFTVPVGGKLKDKATLGVAAFVPKNHAFRARILDEGTPTFFRYDSPPEQLQLIVAAQGRPFDWLSIGAGAQILTNYGGDATFTAVLGTTNAGGITRRSLDNEVTGAVAPLVGIAAGPFKNTRVFATWRGEHQTSYSMPVGVDMGTFGSIDVTVEGTLHYAPNAVVVGAGATFLEDRLLVGVDLGYEQWSRTPPMVAMVGISMPETLTSLGFNKRVESRIAEMNFHDTLVPRVGIEWRQTDRLGLRAGYCYRATPIPDQTGRENFLDSDAHLVAVGAGYSFDDPLGWANRFTLEAAVQLTALASREVAKAEPRRSAVPDYRFGGSAFDLAAAIRYEF